MKGVKQILALSFIVMIGFSCQTKTKEEAVSEISTFNEYNEPFRSQFHFSPPANWMNDPSSG